ncbi:MAG: hypothetical protein KDJ30_15335 [Rhodoblastus sp.]|nr:hypothetical protein [Rhodoblastus sp.]
MIRPMVLSVTIWMLCATAAATAEPFEGAWAQMARECRNREGPSSGVLINLAGRENGKPAPLFDQYEHHCRIEKVERSGKAAKLSLLCFEFWDDYSANRDGRRESVTVAALGRNRMKMDGKTYMRCRN